MDQRFINPTQSLLANFSLIGTREKTINKRITVKHYNQMKRNLNKSTSSLQSRMEQTHGNHQLSFKKYYKAFYLTPLGLGISDTIN